MAFEIPEELKQFCATVIPGTILCKEGEDTHDLFIMIKGKFIIKKGSKVVSRISTPGDYIGEMSTLLKVPRTATIVAEEESKVLRIPADKVLDFMQHSPQLGLKLATILAERLRGMNENFVKLKERSNLIQQGFVGNMESFLAELETKIADNPQGIDPRVSKWFLANFAKVRKQLKLPEFKSSPDSACY